MTVVRSRIGEHLASDAFASRPLYYFDLAPVLARMGQTMLRNPARLEIVCDNCVRSVTHNDETVFAGTGFYLIVTSCDEPDATRLATQISAALLKCFFGAAQFTKEDLEALFRRPAASEVAALVGDAPEREKPVEAAAPAAGTDPLVELASVGIHRPGAFRFGYAPVYDLRRELVMTFFASTIRMTDEEIVYQRDQLAGIGSKDLPRVDQAMLLQALRFAAKLSQNRVMAAVGTSVSFETLAWSKGRQFYQNALRATNSATNAFLIVKIDMVPPGTPAMRLAELVAAVRPFAKRIFVEIPDSDFAALQDNNLGATGYVLTARPGTTRAELTAKALRFAKLCSLQNTLSCVARIPDRGAALAMRDAGIRFGEGSFCHAPIFYDDTPASLVQAFQDRSRTDYLAE